VIDDWTKLFAPARTAKQMFEGTVYEAPGSVTDLIKVTSSQSSGAVFDGVIGPIRWMPRGSTLPQIGDSVLIAYAENGSYWVIAWWPAA
jgi:hypothetical protein